MLWLADVEKIELMAASNVEKIELMQTARDLHCAGRNMCHVAAEQAAELRELMDVMAKRLTAAELALGRLDMSAIQRYIQGTLDLYNGRDSGENLDAKVDWLTQRVEEAFDFLKRAAAAKEATEKAFADSRDRAEPLASGGNAMLCVSSHEALPTNWIWPLYGSELDGLGVVDDTTDAASIQTSLAGVDGTTGSADPQVSGSSGSSGRIRNGAASARAHYLYGRVRSFINSRGISNSREISSPYGSATGGAGERRVIARRRREHKFSSNV